MALTILLLSSGEYPVKKRLSQTFHRTTQPGVVDEIRANSVKRHGWFPGYVAIRSFISRTAVVKPTRSAREMIE